MAQSFDTNQINQFGQPDPIPQANPFAPFTQTKQAPTVNSNTDNSTSNFSFSRFKKILLGILVMLLILGLAFGIFFYITKINQKKNEESSKVENNLAENRKIETAVKKQSPAPALQSESDDNQSQENIYVNSTIGFSFKAPQNWEKVQNDSGFVYSRSPEKEFDPNEVEFHANLNFVTEELPSPITLDEYSQVGNASRAALVQNYQFLGTTKETLGGEGAIIDDYFATLGSITVRQRQIYAIRGQKAYIFTFSSLPESWEKNLTTFDEIRNSFTFTGTVSGVRIGF